MASTMSTPARPCTGIPAAVVGHLDLEASVVEVRAHPSTARTIRASDNAGPRPTNGSGREIGNTRDAKHSADEARQPPLPEPEQTP
jgi:hypothetical protein